MAENVRKFLEQTSCFSSLSSRDLERVASLVTPRYYEHDEYLFLEGETISGCGIIYEGQIKLIKHSGTGKDLVLDILGTGRFLGLEALLENSLCSATAQAMQPSAVLWLSKQDMRALLRDYPEAALDIMRDLSRRLEEAYQMMRSLALERVERRIALNLIKLAGRLGTMGEDGSILINLPLNRQDIADMSGTTIETAIRTMSKFQREGLVQSDNGKVRLLKPHKIVLIAEDLLEGQQGIFD